MEYWLLIAVAVIAALFLYKWFKPSSPTLGFAPLDEGEAIDEIAASKAYSSHGKSVGAGNAMRMLKAYDKIAVRANDLFDYERWLYENFDFLLAHARAQKHCRHRYMRLAAYRFPRIYDLCDAMVRGNNGAIDCTTVAQSVKRFHRNAALTFAEVCALPDMLQYCLTAYCAAIAAKAVAMRKIKSASDADAKHHRIDADRFGDDAYLYFLYAAVSSEERVAIERMCLENGASVSARCDRFTVELAKLNGLISSAVTSLRKIPSEFTAEFVLSLSVIDRVMQTENAMGYTEATTETKYEYCRQIAKTAKRRKTGEQSVAELSVTAAREKKTDISFAVLHPPFGKRAMRLYIALQWAFALLVPIAVAVPFGLWGLVFYFMGIPIAFALGVSISATAVRLFFPRRFVPRVDLEKTDAEHPTLIVVPTLVASEKEIEDAFRNLETLACANPNARYGYGLLLDYLPQKDGAICETDAKLTACVQNAYKRSAVADRSFVLIRTRYKNADGMWCGWEKKRGALIELNQYILTGELPSDYTVLGTVPQAEFVITLDSDTMINCADGLVAMLAHPYNKDVNVIGLSMRTENESARATGFTRLFSGAVGLHAYSQTLADPSNDLFGHGNFTGKGIYRVKRFHELTGAAFQADTLLSHDFIEGAFAGYRDSDLVGTDTFPSDFSAYLSRKMRWLRGDLQCLPYLKRRIKNFAGDTVDNPLTPIDKHHIATVAVLGFLPIASLGFLLASVFTAPILLIAAFAVPIYSFLASVRVSALRGNFSFVSEFLRQTFAVAVLPIEAYYHAVAIVVTAVRLKKRKRLMEWKTAAHFKGRVQSIPSIATGIGLIVCAAVLRLHPIFYCIGILQLAAIAFERLSARRLQPMRKRKPTTDALLREEARKSWAYFAAAVTEENGYLPPDNYSETANAWTYRTSPTDVGMAIVAAVSAALLNFVSYSEAESFVGNITEAIEKAPKWKGHLYNWTDCAGRVCEPKYVSTVDSANLLASLQIASAYFPDLADRLNGIIARTDMAALWDCKRGLLRIGYNETTDIYDIAHYDMLGSESLTAYLCGIGYGKIPTRAWANLSRNATRYVGRQLVSWTGGIFEYLLPTVFYPYPSNSLLGVTVKNTVRSHMKYARKTKQNVWGVSECQVTENDAGEYDYRACGVPFLAVDGMPCATVAPYASLLASPIAPDAVAENLQRLTDGGAVGKFGYYESVTDGKPIRSYMTHHKGMALAAVCNALTDGALWKLTLRHGQGRAAALLVCEPPDFGRVQKRRPQRRTSDRPASYPIAVKDGVPQYAFLTDGSYGVVLDEQMRGYAYRDDYLTSYKSASGGTRLRLTVGEYTLPIRAQSYTAARAVYGGRVRGVSATCTVTVETNGERRKIKFKNTTDKTVTVGASVTIDPSFSPNGESALPFGCRLTVTDDYAYAIANKQVPTNIIGLRIDGGQVHYTRGGTAVEPKLCAETKLTVIPHGTAETTVRLCAAYSVDALQQALYAKATPFGETLVRGKAFAPAPQTAYLGSRILSGLGAATDAALPSVVLEAGDERLREKLGELKKLYRFGVRFDTVVKSPRDVTFQAFEAARFAVESTDIDAYRAVRVGCRTDVPPTAFVLPSADKPHYTDANKKLRPEKLCVPAAVCRTAEGIYDAEATFYPLAFDASRQAVLSDGAVQIVCGDHGIDSIENGRTIWAQSDGIPAVMAVVGEGGTVWSIEQTAKDGGARQVKYNAAFVEYACGAKGLTATHNVAVAFHQNATVHTVTVTNRLPRKRKLTVMLAVRIADGFGQAYCLDYRKASHRIVAHNTKTDGQIYLYGEKPYALAAFSQESFCNDGQIVRICDEKIGGYIPVLAYAVQIEMPSLGAQTVRFALSDRDDVSVECLYPLPQPLFSIRTGDPKLDILLRRLPYAAYGTPHDTIESKLSAMHALLYIDAASVRARILEIAAKQTTDGGLTDGTSCAALLSLPICVDAYIAHTGDTDVLTETIPFFARSGGDWKRLKRSEPLTTHCLRILFGYAAGGKHNAAEDMLFAIAVRRFIGHCRDTNVRLRLLDCKKNILDTVLSAWDGDCFLQNGCDNAQKVVALPQALSVFCLPRGLAARAVRTVFDRLWIPSQKRFCTQTPDDSRFPVGVGENGGQSTAVTVAFIRALHALGDSATESTLLDALLSAALERSPFALAAQFGTGEWTEYHAGVGGAELYAYFIEDVLGIELKPNGMTIEPDLPKQIEKTEVCVPSASVEVTVDNCKKGDVWVLKIDGIRYNTNRIVFSDSIKNKPIELQKV